MYVLGLVVARFRRKPIPNIDGKGNLVGQSQD